MYRISFFFFFCCFSPIIVKHKIIPNEKTKEVILKQVQQLLLLYMPKNIFAKTAYPTNMRHLIYMRKDVHFEQILTLRYFMCLDHEKECVDKQSNHVEHH